MKLQQQRTTGADRTETRQLKNLDIRSIILPIPADYRLNSRGKCLDGTCYGYVTFEELDRHCYVFCETCGQRFDLMDSNNCNVFPCDDCGDGYCPDCFIKRHGKADFDSMMDAWESYCPDCWPKYKQEIMSR